MRKKIYLMVEPHYYSGRISIYNIFLVMTILAGAFPMMTRKQLPWFRGVEIFAAVFFVLDYILRWVTADFKTRKKGRAAFLLYPRMNMAIVDFAAAAAFILLAFVPGAAGWRWLMLFRICGVLKLLRYLYSKMLIKSVLLKQRKQLLAVCYIALEYIFITALIVFNAEPETFPNFFKAVYWATVSLTTVGYGDIYPVSVIGQVIAMVSSFFGIAVIAMPAGIITAGIIQELDNERKKS